MVSFLVDQQLPRALALHLTGLGHDATHIKDYPGGATLPDTEVALIPRSRGSLTTSTASSQLSRQTGHKR
jgi:predicted nuclease of predicted toxin-antitoxin system